MMKVRLINSTKDPEQIIEKVYLNCRNIQTDLKRAQQRRSLEDRIESIFKSKHFGLFEHAIATFQVEGISRACTHQLVRHRIASYGQLSMRYVEPSTLKTIIPPSIKNNTDALVVYNSLFNKCRSAYEVFRSLGIKKEDARFIIPIGIETQITITMNFRSWLHFLKLRTSTKAQWEIREMANQIWSRLQTIAPNVFSVKYTQYWE